MMKLSFVFFLFLAVGLAIADEAVDRSRQDCVDDNLCFIRVKGTQCADGKESGFSIMYRKGAKNLFLYLDGGGACWSKATCEKGTAATLTDEPHYEGPYFKQDPKSLNGWADLNNPGNPIGQGHHFVRVPYCTGDIFMGDKVTDYGTAAKPNVVRHVGYRNLTLVLAEIQKRFPDPDRIFYMGTSAGGLGATYNLHQLRGVYPRTKVFALNDGGLPFKTPFVPEANLEELYTTWGAHQTNPAHSTWARERGENLASAIVAYNQKEFPDVSYGFISSYKDWTMTLFARMLSAGSFTTAVKKIMISLADEEFTKAPNSKVFYLDDYWHGYASKDPNTVVSKGVKLSDWVAAGVADAHGWADVRPDKP
jgi:hypothetical protein